jgi:type IV pilus assembly protein PilC
MVEFKFTAQRLNGQNISGTLSAVSASDGKKKIQRLAEKNKLKINTVQKKSTYLYRVRKGDEKPIRGEQKAFSKGEVEEALSRLGYKVLSVNMKLLDFQRKPPTAEIVTFVKISAELLDQKLAYSDVLTLLINDTPNPALKSTLKEINNDL